MGSIFGQPYRIRGDADIIEFDKMLETSSWEVCIDAMSDMSISWIDGRWYYLLSYEDKTMYQGYTRDAYIYRRIMNGSAHWEVASTKLFTNVTKTKDVHITTFYNPFDQIRYGGSVGECPTYRQALSLNGKDVIVGLLGIDGYYDYNFKTSTKIFILYPIDENFNGGVTYDIFAHTIDGRFPIAQIVGDKLYSTDNRMIQYLWDDEGMRIVYDDGEKVLHVVRDRIRMKPIE